jgi:hypothetical protein
MKTDFKVCVACGRSSITHTDDLTVLKPPRDRIWPRQYYLHSRWELAAFTSRQQGLGLQPDEEHQLYTSLCTQKEYLTHRPESQRAALTVDRRRWARNPHNTATAIVHIPLLVQVPCHSFSIFAQREAFCSWLGKKDTSMATETESWTLPHSSCIESMEVTSMQYGD